MYMYQCLLVASLSIVSKWFQRRRISIKLMKISDAKWGKTQRQFEKRRGVLLYSNRPHNWSNIHIWLMLRHCTTPTPYRLPCWWDPIFKILDSNLKLTCMIGPCNTYQFKVLKSFETSNFWNFDQSFKISKFQIV